MSRWVWPLVLAVTLAGCQRYDAAICDDLAMKKYQGRPFEAAEYDRHCKDKIKHAITQDVCQRALVALIFHGQEAKLKQDFGANIMACFTKEDLARFLRAPGGTNSIQE